jgi:hypothetical protein
MPFFFVARFLQFNERNSFPLQKCRDKVKIQGHSVLGKRRLSAETKHVKTRFAGFASLATSRKRLYVFSVA